MGVTDRQAVRTKTMTGEKWVYLSGPMSGIPAEVYRKSFTVWEMLLFSQGYYVINPCRLAPCRWPWLYKLLGYRLTLAYDLWWLHRCQFIFMLPGSEQSKGARLERRKAREWGIGEVRGNKKTGIWRIEDGRS